MMVINTKFMTGEWNNVACGGWSQEILEWNVNILLLSVLFENFHVTRLHFSTPPISAPQPTLDRPSSSCPPDVLKLFSPFFFTWLISPSVVKWGSISMLYARCFCDAAILFSGMGPVHLCYLLNPTYLLDFWLLPAGSCGHLVHSLTELHRAGLGTFGTCLMQPCNPICTTWNIWTPMTPSPGKLNPKTAFAWFIPPPSYHKRIFHFIRTAVCDSTSAPTSSCGTPRPIFPTLLQESQFKIGHWEAIKSLCCFKKLSMYWKQFMGVLVNCICAIWEQ